MTHENNKMQILNLQSIFCLLLSIDLDHHLFDQK